MDVYGTYNELVTEAFVNQRSITGETSLSVRFVSVRSFGFLWEVGALVQKAIVCEEDFAERRGSFADRREAARFGDAWMRQKPRFRMTIGWLLTIVNHHYEISMVNWQSH